MDASSLADREAAAERLRLARRCPDVDVTLRRVAVDLGELLVREVEVVERRDVLLELRDAARADQGRRHAWIAERPGQRHLGEGLAPSRSELVQRPDLVQG